MAQKKPTQRKQEIIKAAVAVALRDGFLNMRRETVADMASCATGTVNLYFGNMNQLRNAVMRRAIADRVLPIVATGLAMGHTQAIKAPPDLQREATQSLMRG